MIKPDQFHILIIYVFLQIFYGGMCSECVPKNQNKMTENRLYSHAISSLLIMNRSSFMHKKRLKLSMLNTIIFHHMLLQLLNVSQTAIVSFSCINDQYRCSSSYTGNLLIP